MNILNLNKKLQDKKLKEFQEKAQKCAEEIDEIMVKYELKIIPFIQTSSWGNSPLMRSMTAQYTFAPLTPMELESIKLKQKQDEAKDTQPDSEKTD